MNAKEAAILTKKGKNNKLLQLDNILSHIRLAAQNGQSVMYWDAYINPCVEEALKALGYKVELSGNIYWDHYL